MEFRLTTTYAAPRGLTEEVAPVVLNGWNAITANRTGAVAAYDEKHGTVMVTCSAEFESWERASEHMRDCWIVLLARWLAVHNGLNVKAVGIAIIETEYDD